MRTLILLLCVVEIITCPINNQCVVKLDDIETRNEFHTTVEEQDPQVVTFALSGIELPEVKNDSKTYDPKMWAWATEEGVFLLELPIDCSILSTGLLTLRVMRMDVKLKSDPPFCERNVTQRCLLKLVASELMLMTKEWRPIQRAIRDESVICRSVYSHKSFFSSRVVGVGFECCERDANFTLGNSCKPVAFERPKIRFATFIIGFLLPLLYIPIILVHPKFRPGKMTEHITSYMTRRLKTVLHCNLKGKGYLKNKTMLMLEDDLLGYSEEVSFRTFLKDYEYDRPKMNVTLLFLSQYLLLFFWMFQYAYATAGLAFLDTGEKIAFNLRNNPIAWLFCSKDHWTFYVALIMIISNFMNIIFLVLLWLQNITKIRKLSLKYALAIYLKYPIFPTVEDTVQNILRIFTILMGINSLITVYCFFHGVVYTLIGLVLNIEIAAPWLTGGALVIFYVNDTISNVNAEYTRIQRMIFQYFLDRSDISRPIYTARVMIERRIRSHDLNKKVMVDKDRMCINYESKKSDMPILFKDACDGTLYIHKPLFLSICQKVSPFRECVQVACLKLLLTLSFTGLVVFTMSSIRWESKSESSVIVTSVGTLLAALLPQLSNVLQNSESEGRQREVLQYKVQRFIRASRPYLMVIDDMIICHPVEYDRAPETGSMPSSHFGEDTKLIGDDSNYRADEVDFQYSDSRPGSRASLLRPISIEKEHLPLLERRKNGLSEVPEENDLMSRLDDIQFMDKYLP